MGSDDTPEIVPRMSREVTKVPLYFNPGVLAHGSSLRGPTKEGPTTLAAWNVYEWQFSN